MKNKVTAKALAAQRKLNARRDSADFRDLMYVPTLVAVPKTRPLSAYLRADTPVLDQKKEGACTGFALATVVNHLLRTQIPGAEREQVSPHMLYSLARRYDEWPGVNYEGSSARGAIKGWHKHGVCALNLWKSRTGSLTHEVMDDAVRRPLGAYFRVNHKDLVAMHCAITEAGILYATGTVHEGWDAIDRQGHIPLRNRPLGGHAFAIVGYDEGGFWIQNSWGREWGLGGFARLSYDDWLTNGDDVWVARLGVPMEPAREGAPLSGRRAPARSQASVNTELRRHIVSLGDDGILKTNGTYGTDRRAVEENIAAAAEGNRVVFYAHGGLVNEDEALKTVGSMLPVFSASGVYPVSFIWHSDFLSSLLNVLKDAVAGRRPEGAMQKNMELFLDRIDESLEPLARNLGGKLLWDQMKANAIGATRSTRGGARLALDCLNDIAAKGLELHLVGHSAGGILFAPLVQRAATRGVIRSGPLKGERGLGMAIDTCTLWAPAITINLFKETYLPLIRNGQIGKFTLFTLDDQTEQDDDCNGIYNKSLLYLVSRAFEKEREGEGEPLLGLARHVDADPELRELFTSGDADWIVAPNQKENRAFRSRARRHVDFDDDEATVGATIRRIGGGANAERYFEPHTSSAKLRARRKRIESI